MGDKSVYSASHFFRCLNTQEGCIGKMIFMVMSIQARAAGVHLGLAVHRKSAIFTFVDASLRWGAKKNQPNAKGKHRC